MAHLQKINDNGYTWYECSCCPYGYHVDVDFVRYCDSVKREIDRCCTESNKRRQQRQSMEVLLGITTITTQTTTTTPATTATTTTTRTYDNMSEPRQNYNTFDDAVSDFERTLQRLKKNKMPPNNLPDVTAVSDNSIKRIPSPSSMSSHSGGSSSTVLPDTNNKDFDTVSIESFSGKNPLALQNIREQMALSLERTRNLENQVKLIPELEAELMKVKEENRKLWSKLKKEEIKLNTINANYLYQNNKIRSQSFTDIDSLEGRISPTPPPLPPPPPPPRKDFGVMCGVLTRNVGVGHQNPNTKTVSTTTINGNLLSDKWYNEKMKFLNENDEKINIGTQTLSNNEIIRKRNIGSQTIEKKLELKIGKIDSFTQTTTKKFIDNYVTACPTIKDFSCQKYIESYNIGVSDDNICDILCDKCNVEKQTIGVGPDKYEDSHTMPISLANLTVPRSKSFTLNDDKLNFKTRNRTVASQYDYNLIKSNKTTQYDLINTLSKYCQYDIKNQTKSTQCEIKMNNKSTQIDEIKKVKVEKKLELKSKNTDTKDLITLKSIGCEINLNKKDTKNIGCNTTITTTAAASTMTTSTEKIPTSPTTQSRIPRPQIPTTPVEARKFKRQDTYTKEHHPHPHPHPYHPIELSGLDLSEGTITTTTIATLDKVKENLKLPQSENGINKVQIQENTLPLPENVVYQPGQRKKRTPSKEMQAAMKVLNDCIEKGQINKNTSAIQIIQEEWFKISSLLTANPLDVEDYLDAFEDISSNLLEYIVNISDDSGNTAMHYAVSHGNFDVVSILLDSKVCDINKTNKAGYTCVMLVSLAEVRSVTHANVVRKLFQLADVNLRAKQHGQTALMLAVSHGRLDMVKMLLEAGADINIQDEDGSTALMCAAEHGHIEIVKHFLSHPDCNSNITDVDGSTALKIAMEAGHRHIGVLLYAHERNLMKGKKSSPKTPSSPLPLRSSHRALTDLTKTNK